MSAAYDEFALRCRHMGRRPVPILSGSGELSTVDYHTAGEPFRIVVGGIDPPEGKSVIERRSWAQQHLDDVRALLVNEPRGHADMYGGFVTPPDDADAELGVVFFHKDGFSTACGHGTIALATWAIDCGRMAANQDGLVEMAVDVPSGRLRVVVELDSQGRADKVRFWNVDAFVSARSVEVSTTAGSFTMDVAFGGAFYGLVLLEGVGGLEPTSGCLGELIETARQIKADFAGHPAVDHDDDRLSGMYGVVFHQHMGEHPLHRRNVTVFADGEVDRSPCGSGTSALGALLVAQGHLQGGDHFVNQGITGAVFDAKIEGVTEQNGRCLVATSVAGSAYKTGESRFSLDLRDPIGLGFQLR